MTRDPKKPAERPGQPQTQGPAGPSEPEETDLFLMMLKARDWWRRHGHWVLVVVLVIVAAWAGKRWWDASQQRQQAELQNALQLEDDPTELQRWAERVDQPNYRARFLLRAAESLERAAGGPFDIVDDQQAGANLEQAQALYLRAAEVEGADLTWRLTALRGAAVVAEKRGQWDEALQLHEQVANEAADIRPQIARRARASMDLIEWMRQGVPTADARVVDRFQPRDLPPRVRPNPSWHEAGHEAHDDPLLPIPGSERWRAPGMQLPDRPEAPVPAAQQPAPPDTLEQPQDPQFPDPTAPQDPPLPVLPDELPPGIEPEPEPGPIPGMPAPQPGTTEP